MTDRDIEAIHYLSNAGWVRKKIGSLVGVSESAIYKVLKGQLHCYKPTIIKSSLRKDGYPFVALSKDGKVKQITLHHLVTDAFIGPRPDGMEVNHKDGNKQNASRENLEYVTKSENALHSVDTLGNSHKITLADARVIRSLKGISPRRELASRFGISVHMISAIWMGKSWNR